MTIAPQIGSSLINQTVVEDTPFVYRIPRGAFINPNGGDLFFTALSAGGQPIPWIAVDPFTDPDNIVLSGTPPQNFTGTMALALSAYVLADVDEDGVFTD